MAKAKKEEKVKDIFEDLEKIFGVGTIVSGAEVALEEVKESTSTGSLTLDLATGIGGIPKGGKLTHILGKESASKTTLSLHIIANEQKKGNYCAFLDVEGTLQLDYAQRLGVDLDKLHIVNREKLLKSLKIEKRKEVAGEEWLDVLIKMLNSNLYGIIVLDSVATLTPLSEIENGVAGGGQMARVGAMLSKAMRNVNAALINADCGLIFLNQYRISPGAYGNPFVEVGGEAIKYYASMKIEIARKYDRDSDREIHGLEVTGSITKSKVSKPHKKFEYYVALGEGIIQSKEVFDLALEFGFITKKGGWYYVDDTTKLQGEDKILAFLDDNPDFFEVLQEKVLDRIKNPIKDVEQTEEELINPGDTVEEVGIQEEG